MTKFCLFMIANLIVFNVWAQFFDNFSDGDFTNSPAWQADPADFIINNQQQLQSNNVIANATFQITTTNTLALKAQWDFWLKLDFNPSSVNYVDVWLTSDLQELSNLNNTGYFVRIGSTDDNISLYKKPLSGTAQKIIEGEKGILNSSSSKMKIRVIRTEQNRWILLRNMTGAGEVWKSDGEITDTELANSSYFGLSIRQSTSSFFQKHFFDDFEVKQLQALPSKLEVMSVKATGPQTLSVTFNSPVNTSSASDILHYHVNNMGNPLSAVPDILDGTIVHLTFDNEITPDLKNTIIVDAISDVYGNIIHQEMIDFYYRKSTRYDVVIHEVLADPSPQIGLPAQKFIELRNNAAFPINLTNWQLRDDNNVATLPDVELQPDSFLIITTLSGLASYQPYGKTVAVSGFPSLNISGSRLALYDNSGNLIHAMRYDLSTYKNEVKKEGGFSLEMINPDYGCGGTENWIASNDASGGTPGIKNSVYSTVVTESTINFVNAYLKSPDTLVVQFNKTLDSTSAVFSQNYNLSNGLSIGHIECIAPFFNEVRISLLNPVSTEHIYLITAQNITDCAGSGMGNKNSIRFGLTSQPQPMDIVINEILSEPKTSGAEYIELYNASNRIIDLTNLYLANRNSSGDPSSITRIRSTSTLFFPGDFVVLTKDAQSTIRDYPFGNVAAILMMQSMPSIPNDKGYVLILDQQGAILDEVNYDKSWHFSLIKDKKGVSLERIIYQEPSERNNFHSASKDVGYGTPGTKNSQFKTGHSPSGQFTVTPEIFSPDHDGIDDYVTIHYEFNNPGYVTNIKIFDAAGRMVRHLEKNALSGKKGYYKWDGLDDRSKQLPQGIYLIYFESFNENGQKVIHKKNIVLARRQ